MKNHFFYKLYLFDKRLFFLVALFSILTVLGNIMGDEITPFFIWAMYSEKESTSNRYEIFKIQVNDSLLVDYTAGRPDNNRYFLTAPLSYYNKIFKSNHTEPTLNFFNNKLGEKYSLIQPMAKKLYYVNLDSNQFVRWYARYLEQSVNVPVRKLKVAVLVGHFAKNGQVQIDSSYSLIQWKQP